MSNPNPQEALERLTRWRDKGDGAEYGIGDLRFERDVLALLSMLEWRPISEAPKDETTIVRWHRIWKCPVAVQRNNERYPGYPEWITATRDQTWPEDAFLPFWMPALPAALFPEAPHVL